jgi:hypothetical protein
MSQQNDDQKVIEIMAEIICFVLLGTRKDINNYISSMKKKENNNTIYLSLKLSIPFSQQMEKIEKNLGYKIILDKYIESIQCLAYADLMNKHSYVLMCLEQENEYHTLTYPKFNFNDDEPESTILKQLKGLNDNIPTNVKKSIHPLSIVGENNEIVVFSANFMNKIRNDSIFVILNELI